MTQAAAASGRGRLTGGKGKCLAGKLVELQDREQGTLGDDVCGEAGVGELGGRCTGENGSFIKPETGQHGTGGIGRGEHLNGGRATGSIG